MAREEFFESIKKAMAELSPSEVDLLEFEEGAAHVLVVSESFKGKNLTSRLDMLHKEAKSAGLEPMILTFEPYTKGEFDEVERKSREESERSPLQSHHVAVSG